jgi:hypothetical protein
MPRLRGWLYEVAIILKEIKCNTHRGNTEFTEEIL